MRYLLTIEYDGTPYCGWQFQENLPTIQNSLQKAILSMTGEPAEVYGAGRTDAGVHATHQKAHVDLSKEFTPYRLREGVNFYLQEEAISIVNVEIIPDHIHARFSALQRSYRYKLLNRHVISPLLHNRAWHYKHDLDLEGMKTAATHFLGTHDFSAFRSQECQSSSPVKTLDKMDMHREEDMIIFEVSSRSFLHHQVRNMVGTLVWIGRGKLLPDCIPRLFASGDRRQAGPTAPACGLYLTNVAYPELP